MTVHLRSIYRGGAWVELDGEIIGNVSQTDEGTWWANLPIDKPGEVRAFEIVADCHRRRDAVSDLVHAHKAAQAVASPDDGEDRRED